MKAITAAFLFLGSSKEEEDPLEEDSSIEEKSLEESPLSSEGEDCEVSSPQEQRRGRGSKRQRRTRFFIWHIVRVLPLLSIDKGFEKGKRKCFDCLPRPFYNVANHKGESNSWN